METPQKLAVIWTSADREVALDMVFMYTHNSKLREWWHEVRLIVWGPSGKLLLADAEIQQKIAQMSQDGVELWACKACADRYGISAQLEQRAIEVFHVGEAVTGMLQSDEWKVLTF